MEQLPTATARPASIVTFERCYLGAWILGLANTAFNFRPAIEAMDANPELAQMGTGFSSTMVLGGIAFSAILTLTLWYFAARRGAVFAKWFVVVLYAIGLISFLAQAMRGIVFSLSTPGHDHSAGAANDRGRHALPPRCKAVVRRRG